MVDLDWKTQMVASDIPTKSPRLSNKLQISIPTPPAVRVADLSPAPESSCAAYEYYLRLPELRKLWSSRDFPGWKNEPVLKPALQGLEITFRFISTVLSDPRPYANRREWKRQLESLATNQVEIIALLCEDGEQDVETRGAVPIVDLTSSAGVLMRENSSVEVWKHAGETTVVSRSSEASLLPRLAAWQKSEDVAEKILYSIECAMRRCPYTLGVGEPNLSGKPSLDYDKLCNPAELHALKKSPSEQMNLNNFENQTLYATHQILESWIYTSEQLLNRITDQIEQKSFENASSNCWVLEKVWKLLSQIEDLHLLMDPNDFLRLKNQLSIKASSERSVLFQVQRIDRNNQALQGSEAQGTGNFGCRSGPQGWAQDTRGGDGAVPEEDRLREDSFAAGIAGGGDGGEEILLFVQAVVGGGYGQRGGPWKPGLRGPGFRGCIGPNIS